MHDINKTIVVRSLLILPFVAIMLALLMSTNALAQQPADKTKSWHFGASIYGWFPDISGKTSFSPDGSDSDFEIDFDDILDSLEFALMGSFDMRKGRWGIFTDALYMDAGNSKNTGVQGSIGASEIPVNVNADVKLDLKSLIWTLTGYYRAIDTGGTTLDVVAGTRYLDVEQEVNWDVTGNVGDVPPLERIGDAKMSLANWDLIIGVRGRFAFGASKAWFVPYYLDIGTGESDLTWQGVAGLGYAFRWGELVAAWRYLYYDMPSGMAIGDMNFSGPVAGVTFRW